MLKSLFVSNTFSKYIRTDVNSQLGNYSSVQDLEEVSLYIQKGTTIGY